MQELKAEKPLESPAGTDPVTRLIARLRDEGFTTEQSEDEWRDFGEIIFRRDEKISFVRGETYVDNGSSSTEAANMSPGKAITYTRMDSPGQER